jgi:uncharacterized repeat protein (TIGR03803 family)
MESYAFMGSDADQGCGTVFKLSPGGTYTVLHIFTPYPDGDDGGFPNGLVRDWAGNLYGTARRGGSISTSYCESQDGCGVVFKLSPGGTETVLYTFTGGVDGASPGGLIRDAAGNLYGIASFGGVESSACTYYSRNTTCGVVFELIRCDSEPSGYEFKVLHSFTGAAGGGIPMGGLLRDAAGNLYGTTLSGGGVNRVCIGDIGETCGVVFRLSATGIYTVLHRFTGGADGGNPVAGLLRDGAGNLYGTTEFGGGACFSNALTCGVVFELIRCDSEPSGYEFKVLHTFTGADGASPSAGLIQDPAGNLYGTAGAGGSGFPEHAGVVFRLAP